MKGWAGVFLLTFAGIAKASSPAEQAMRGLQLDVAGFVGTVVAAAFIGAVISRSLAKRPKSTRRAAYRITVLCGLAIAVWLQVGR